VEEHYSKEKLFESRSLKSQLTRWRKNLSRERLRREEEKFKQELTIKNLRRRLEIAVYAPYYILKRLRGRLILLGSMFLICALIFMWYQGLGFLSGLYGAVSTITTIGLYVPPGSVQSMDPVEQILLVIVIIVSVGLAATLVQGLVSATISAGYQTDELIRRMARRMENHVIVVGYKFLGKYVVTRLRELKLEFIVIVRYRSQLSILRSRNIPALYSTVPRLYEALEDANVRNASTLVSTLDRDGENMLSVLTAKRLNDKIKTLSIVNDREAVEGMKNAGADVAIPYFVVMGQMLGLSSVSKAPAGILFADNLRSKFVVDFQVETSGATYADIKGICPVIMVSRRGEFTYELKDDFQFEKGDSVYAFVDRDSIKAFGDRLKSLSTLQSKRRAKR
jgi:voltage-gated potassium channel